MIRKFSAVLWLGCALLWTPAALAQTAQPTVPAPWNWTDVGAVGTAGSAHQGSDGDLYASGAGSDIWGTADSFLYVYQPIRDGQITSNVGSETNTSPFAKVGVMIRQTLDPDSPEVILDVKPDGGIEFMTRASRGGETTFLAGASVPAAPTSGNQISLGVSLTLYRRGTTVLASYCLGGGCQSIGGPVSFPTGPALIGVAVTSHDPSVLNNAYFPASMPTVTSVPSPWTTSDVGSVGTAGEATYDTASGTFYVSGAGSDIWGSNDSFHAVTEFVTADSMVTARVVGEQNTNMFAKAGVVFGSLNANAARVILDAKPDGNLEFMARMEDGAVMSFIGGASATFPVWLRLTRTGGQFTGAYSSDGQTWTSVGTVAATLSTTVQTGLAVTSHDPGVLNAARFDNVSTSGETAPVGQNLLTNPGFEDSTVPSTGPGWISDVSRQSPAQSETAAPFSGFKDGACRTTSSLDCGIYQEVTVPVAGNYLFTVYASTDKPGALVGMNLNGSGSGRPVAVGGYAPYSIGVYAVAGDVIRVWMYSPASAGSVTIDDATLMIDNGPH